MQYEVIFAQETFLCRKNWEEEGWVGGDCHAESSEADKEEEQT
jgi:hypothetical protein